jgi:hypothetical protein
MVTGLLSPVPPKPAPHPNALGPRAQLVRSSHFPQVLPGSTDDDKKNGPAASLAFDLPTYHGSRRFVLDGPSSVMTRTPAERGDRPGRDGPH